MIDYGFSPPAAHDHNFGVRVAEPLASFDNREERGHDSGDVR
jgi:hypothetical protein